MNRAGARRIAWAAVLLVGAPVAVISSAGAPALAGPNSPTIPTIAWVTSQGDGTVTPIDTATNTPGTPILVDPSHQSGPLAIAITPDASAVYVTNIGDNSVRRIDAATHAVGPPIYVGVDRVSIPEGIAIAPDGSTAYVTDYSRDGGGYVTPVDLATGTAESPISMPTQVSAIAITPNGKTAFVGGVGSTGGLLPINLATRAVGKAIPLNSYPYEIAIAPDGDTAYVVDFFDTESVTPVDIRTKTAEPSFPVGRSTQGIAISPDGSTAYVAGDGIYPVDLKTQAVGTAIYAGRADAYGIAFTPDGSTAYAALTFARRGRVAVIDVAAGKHRLPVPVGEGSTYVAVTPDQAPHAAFRVHRAVAGSETTFDAGASTSASSPIVDYHWDFGDGSVTDTVSPTAGHTYVSPAIYTVVLTLTDAAGTSTQRVFTGQTMSRNGGPTARRAHSVTIS